LVIVLFVAAEMMSALLRASPAAPTTLALVPVPAATHRRYAISKNPAASVAAMVLAALLPTLALSVSLIARA
jgi:hypothetical protein